MKILYRTLIAGTLLTTLGACDDLTELPEDKLSPEHYFSNETECELYTNQFYELMPTASEGSFNWYYEEGEHIVTNTIERELLGSRAVPTKASEVGWNWELLRKINYYLKYSHRCSDEKIRNKYDGIAYFFRAYFYYNMMTKFGELPWYDEPLESNSDQLRRPRDSRDVIINHIIDDCDHAHDLLAAISTDRTTYTINCWTPLALKSRACLFEGSFRKYHDGDVFNPDHLPWEELLREGAKAAKEVFTNGGYTLYKEGKEPYRDLFATFAPRECENIWTRGMSETFGIKHNANGWANARKVGFTKRFVNLYLNADGSRYTDDPEYATKLYSEEYKNRDPRMFQTVYCPGYIQKGADKTVATDFVTSLSTGYKFIKYVMDAKYNSWGSSIVPLPLFRLGEQYLNYAECLAELGEINQTDLDISINKLRDRVGMPDLKLDVANATPDPYMISPTTGYPNVTKSANTGVILEIRRERLIELALEGFHYNDILRWKEGKVYEQPFYGQYFPGEGKYDLTGDGKANISLYIEKKVGGIGITPLKIGTDLILSDGDKGYILIHGDEALQRHWNEDRDYLYGIPINERLLTGGSLTQNPGWNDGLSF